MSNADTTTSFHPALPRGAAGLSPLTPAPGSPGPAAEPCISQPPSPAALSGGALTKAHREHRNGSPWAAGVLTQLGVEEQKRPGQPHPHLCGAACPGPALLRLQAGHELALGLAAWAAWWGRAPRPTGCGDRERRPNKAILTLR